ncbi:MAG: immunoglobulin domain-containing protein, partial [Cytophagaceae bacterium]|nr:immunoglobulin domain-containing protein [Cytophagaceae bacterium]
MKLKNRHIIVLFLGFLHTTGLLAQNTATITGTTVGAPTAIFPLLGSTSGACTPNSSVEPYRTYAITSSVTGQITVSITDPIASVANTDDTGLFWYQTTSTTPSGCTNFVAIGNDPVGSGLTFSATANTTYQLVVVGLFSSADGFALSLMAPSGSTLTVPGGSCSGVSITSQAASGSAVCAGGNATVSVSVTGTVTGYQWYKDGSLLSPAQTSATLSLTNVQNSDAGSYSVVVTGACNSFTSTAFSLTVNAPPSVSITGLAASYCKNAAAVTLTGSPTGGSFT